MNKGLKKGLKITGVTVAVILVFMLVLPFMFKDKVIIIVKKEANEMLNAKLDFESLDISLFSHFPSASIELNGLTLSGIDDFENDTLVSAESIDVAVNVMSLFRCELRRFGQAVDKSGEVGRWTGELGYYETGYGRCGRRKNGRSRGRIFFPSEIEKF